MNSSALIIMAKEPMVGSTKTRLCPPLNLEEAALLYEVLLRDTIEMVSGIKDIALAIALTPPESIEYFKRIAPSKTHFIPIVCANIGECLTISMNRLLDLKYERVLALNSDGPSLPAAIIHQAIQSLDNHDLVLGPAEDGGYYLVGLKQLHSKIFAEIEWSTDQVLTQTLHKAKCLGLSVHLLPVWYDIDTAYDIERLRAELKVLPSDALPHTRKLLDQWSEII